MENAKSSLIQDFLEFRGEKTLANREKLVRKICEQYNAQAFESEEKKIVNEILAILSQDVEQATRQLLSDSLKENEDLPRDIAVKLASDKELEVSLPMLQSSSVFTDLDLQMLIKSTSELAKLETIAGRSNLSAQVSDTLVDKEIESVNKKLLENSSAKINESSMQKVLDKFHTSADLMRTLVNRGGLSIGLAERMISMVSSELQKVIVQKYNVSPSVAKKTMATAREEMTLGVVSRGVRPENTVELVNHLYSSGKLSHSIVLRALCRGDLYFFEAGMAKLAGIPAPNARKLVREGDARGFSALFHAASMPPTMLEATEALLKIIIESKEIQAGSKHTPQLIMERIVDNGFDKNIPNMSYFLALIGNAASHPSEMH